MNEKLIIANCSGFLGDRMGAAKEMIDGGHIDVLTGDYLAELTMALLFRMKLKSPEAGYATPFLKQMEGVMGPCMEKGIKIVANAGGLNPLGLAAELEKIAKALGINPIIACIEGDDLLPKLDQLQRQGESFPHLDKGITLKSANAKPITANAYLGGWGITTALDQGADIVVGGRIADAALVSGPAAWKFGWKQDDWDKLAGAYAAGHIIECGTQATGGNYSFFEEVPSFKNVGFPIAEIHEDGSFVITKHPGTGGLVSLGTVTAQLMYEIREPAYLTPDVKVRFDTIRIEQEGEDRVAAYNIKGEPPTATSKVCINNLWGFRNTMTVVLTGLDIEKKAALVEETLFDLLGGKDQFAAVDIQLIRSDTPEPANNDEACARLRISLMDQDKNKVGKLFSAKLVEIALSNIPGFTLTGPPSKATPAIQHWPTLISNGCIQQKVFVNNTEFIVEAVDPVNSINLINPVDLVDPVDPVDPVEAVEAVNIVNMVNPIDSMDKNVLVDSKSSLDPVTMKIESVAMDDLVEIPMGRLFGTRSGDKGGNANLGVWAKNSRDFSFLHNFLTVKQLKQLLPDMEPFEIERYEFPNLLALNFYIKGVLGEGVAASHRSDPQAKTLGEYLRSKHIKVPSGMAGV